jgi:tRNA(fMet)-specific endonuclease VapC
VKRFSLDTNIVADLIRHPAGLIAQRILEFGEERVALSLVVACELRFGAAKRGSARLTKRVEELLAAIEVLPLEAPVDKAYAAVCRTLEAAGTPIGPNDLLIAAQAKTLGMTVVTDNVKEFQRVPGLDVVNWLH